ncbi:unnamed protein product [Parajaminaea phylloscopi]
MVSTRSTTASKRTLAQAFPPTKKASGAPLASRKVSKVVNVPPPPSPSANTTPPKRAATAKAQPDSPPLPILAASEITACTTAQVPSLSFDVNVGKRHLVDADCRFAPLLERIPLRVFEQLDEEGKELDLFKTLVTSILGQQVSWLAARAILYKFTRLYFPELPPTPDFATRPRDSLPFPTPLQVRASSEAELRSAGLSGQKVRYISDIAERFSDGRLDVRKILKMSESEVLEELCKIKGVGPWTAQMLLIFALRRPDILPASDLGVQRGMVLLWASGADGPAIKSAKAKPEPEATTAIESTVKEEGPQAAAEDAHKIEEAVTLAEVSPPGGDGHAQHGGALKNGVKVEAIDTAVPPLPADSGMTAAILNARKNGAKTKGNVYLSPSEMEALAKTWSPYRSLASVVMWALVDA